MRLAAIYIEDHDYLFDSPQTINFGGAFYYEFVKEEDNLVVTRKPNDNFIEGFFDLTKLQTKLTAVNAIVGQNGSGKSTILDIIRSTFIEHKYALPQSKCVFLVETQDSGLPKILRSNFRKVTFRDTSELVIKESKLPSVSISEFHTIYYSPHFDYKYNPNFDNIDDHDISFDKIMDDDLSGIREKAPNGNGFSFSATQELLFKNSLRQIEFLSSELVSGLNIFKDIFHLPDHYEPTLVVRGYLQPENEWNTPNGFRGPLRIISEKVKAEVQNWHLIRKFDEHHKITNTIEIHQFFLKRNLVEAVLSVLYKQMERRNTHLTDGFISYEKFESDALNLDGYDLLLLFIDQATLQTRSGEVIKVFGDGNLKLLLLKMSEAIENSSTEEEITYTTLRTTKERAVEILRLQRSFLNGLNRYHFIFSDKDEVIPKNDVVEEFINYMPFSRRMSSGENALLNFYSRLYTFLNFNFVGNKFLNPKQHYILLFDEADLSFHPSWKKRYVRALLKTIPYFFNELPNSPSVQIVFTTHDPLTLSDLPNSNVIYLERRDYDSPTQVLDYNNENRPVKTFGANISDLLADSFFVEDSLIGEFAFEKISDTIKWLENEANMQNADYYQKVISLIDEPIVQRKLAEMYDDKMQTQFQLNVVNEQIKELEKLRKRLQR